MKTDIITYSLTDRGRQLGNDRDYQKPENLPRLVDAINGPAVQERVKHGDMRGFYTHLPRILFGTKTEGCGVNKGKYMCVEPALRTTHLKAYRDGTVEHQNEFLPTQAGEMCWKLHSKGFGGFSSAILEHASPPDFVGFDYVPEPNFSTNRGYSLALDSLYAATLDSAGGSESSGCNGERLDAVMQAYQDQFAGMQAILDSLNSAGAEHDALRRVIEAQQRRIRELEVNEEGLYSLLEQQPGNDAVLDSLDSLLPMVVEDDRDNYLAVSQRVMKNGPKVKAKPQPVKTLVEAFNSRDWMR